MMKIVDLQAIGLAIVKKTNFKLIGKVFNITSWHSTLQNTWRANKRVPPWASYSLACHHPILTSVQQHIDYQIGVLYKRYQVYTISQTHLIQHSSPAVLVYNVTTSSFTPYTKPDGCEPLRALFSLNNNNNKQCGWNIMTLCAKDVGYCNHRAICLM